MMGCASASPVERFVTILRFMVGTFCPRVNPVSMRLIPTMSGLNVQAVISTG